MGTGRDLHGARRDGRGAPVDRATGLPEPGSEEELSRGLRELPSDRLPDDCARGGRRPRGRRAAFQSHVALRVRVTSWVPPAVAVTVAGVAQLSR